MPKIFRNKIFLVVAAIVVVILTFVIYLLTKPQQPNYEIFTVKKGTVVQEVSVTGNVKPASSVDLAFEKGGRISRVNVKIGDKVFVGQTLVSLENGDIYAQLLQAQANLDSALKGTRPEELQIAQTAVDNAQKNLGAGKAQAEADLQSDYDAALSAIQKSVNVAKTALMNLSDIQYGHFANSDVQGTYLANAKADAVFLLLGEPNAGLWTSSAISNLSGGAFGETQSSAANPQRVLIDQALADTISALQKVRIALSAVPVDSLTSTEKTTLASEKTNIDTEIITDSGKQQAINVQKSTNESTISSLQATLDNAENELTLKKAGSTPEEITVQRANVTNYQAQLAKTIIRSPIDGIVARQDAKVGQIASAGAPIVSVMSANNFEIEANVPEADIAKVKIGDVSQVTLDAYGNDVVFQAKVVKIDPAETVIEGVPTYKVTLQFLNEDSRIKSGMTANLDIVTEKRENALTIPQRAVVSKNGDKIVKVLIGKNITELKVKTGIRGTDGNIEIIEGLKEGDKIIIQK